jgi:hypothetical protein
MRNRGLDAKRSDNEIAIGRVTGGAPLVARQQALRKPVKRRACGEGAMLEAVVVCARISYQGRRADTTVELPVGQLRKLAVDPERFGHTR